jgi:hypothetical protein
MCEPEAFGLSAEAAKEYDRAVQVIGEFTELSEIQQIIRWMLVQFNHIPNEHKFANVTATMAAFTRASHDLEAATVLCQVHCYPQALGLLRSVYEAASIGRTMGLSTSMKMADQWVKGKWQSDQKARQFVRNVMYADAEASEIDAAVESYADTYSLLSKWAHITVDSALTPYADGDEYGFAFSLSPRFNEDFLVFTLNASYILGVYLSYAVYNSVAPDKNTSSEWRAVLDDLNTHKHSLKTGHVPQLIKYAEQMDLRRDDLVGSIRNSSEFRRHMKNSG